MTRALIILAVVVLAAVALAVRWIAWAERRRRVTPLARALAEQNNVVELRPNRRKGAA